MGKYHDKTTEKHRSMMKNVYNAGRFLAKTAAPPGVGIAINAFDKETAFQATYTSQGIHDGDFKGSKTKLLQKIESINNVVVCYDLLNNIDSTVEYIHDILKCYKNASADKISETRIKKYQDKGLTPSQFRDWSSFLKGQATRNTNARINLLKKTVVTEATSPFPDKKEITTPEEFNHMLNTHAKYGYMYRGKYCDGEDNQLFAQQYRTSSYNEFKSTGVGVCWDYVMFEAHWFKEQNIPFKTYYIETDDGSGDFPTHTFLVYKQKDKFCYFESSWEVNAGIYEFKSYTDVVAYVMSLHKKTYNGRSSGVWEYNALSPLLIHQSCVRYMNNVKAIGTQLLIRNVSNPPTPKSLYGSTSGDITDLAGVTVMESLNNSHCKTPKELHKYMIDNFEYGYKGTDGIFYDDETACTHNFEDMSTPSYNEIIDNEFGICWDFTRYAAYWFKERGYEISTIFIILVNTIPNDPLKYFTHTVLFYKEGVKWYAFCRAGIFEYKSYDDAVTHAAERFHHGYPQTIYLYDPFDQALVHTDYYGTIEYIKQVGKEIKPKQKKVQSKMIVKGVAESLTTVTEAVFADIRSIKSPQELYHTLKDKTSYGYTHRGKEYHGGEDDNFEKYKTARYTKFANTGIGTCYDYVMYEATWFRKHGYNYKAVYMELTDKDGDHPSHSFIVYEETGKWYWFEVSWGGQAGIHEFDSFNHAVGYALYQHRKMRGNHPYQIYVYDPLSPHFSGQDVSSYMEAIYQYGRKQSGISPYAKPPSNNNTKLPKVVNESMEPIMEYNTFKTRDRLEFNLEKLKPGTEYNILYITGYSGSGKSTLTKEFQEKYENIIVVSGDLFEFPLLVHNSYLPNDDKKRTLWNINADYARVRMGPLITKFFQYNFDKYSNMLGVAWEDDIMNEAWMDFMYWLDKESKKPEYKDSIIIVEGFQIFRFGTPDFYHGRPMIVNGTSMTESFRRRIIREMDDNKMTSRFAIWKEFFHSFKEELATIPMYRNHSKYLDSLIVAMEQSILAEEAMVILEEAMMPIMEGSKPKISHHDREYLSKMNMYNKKTDKEEVYDNSPLLHHRMMKGLDDGDFEDDRGKLLSAIHSATTLKTIEKLGRYVMQSREMIMNLIPDIEKIEKDARNSKNMPLYNKYKNGVTSKKLKQQADFLSEVYETVLSEKKHELMDKEKGNSKKKPTKESVEPVTEACKDVDHARKFLAEVRRIAKKYNANFFIVTDGASATQNDGNPAVANARNAQKEWEKQNGFDPDEDWSDSIIESILNSDMLEPNYEIPPSEYVQESMEPTPIIEGAYVNPRKVKLGDGAATIELKPGEQAYGVERLDRDISEDTFLLADVHIGDPSNNPVEAKRKMIYIQKVINKMVPENGTLLFLGDLSGHGLGVTKDMVRNFVSGIKCKNLYLILGNDDYYEIHDYVQMGFLTVTNRFQKGNLIFTHCPEVNVPKGALNIHAHIHGSKEYWGCEPEGHVDIWSEKYIPITVEATVQRYYNGEYVAKKRIPVTEATKRSNLSDDEFGVSSQRKFPLDTREHVISAIKLFNWVDPEHEQELADKINKKIKEYKITASDIRVGGKNRFRKYIKSALLESLEVVLEAPTNLNPRKNDVEDYTADPDIEDEDEEEPEEEETETTEEPEDNTDEEAEVEPEDDDLDDYTDGVDNPNDDMEDYTEDVTEDDTEGGDENEGDMDTGDDTTTGDEPDTDNQEDDENTEENEGGGEENEGTEEEGDGIEGTEDEEPEDYTAEVGDGTDDPEGETDDTTDDTANEEEADDSTNDNSNVKNYNIILKLQKMQISLSEIIDGLDDVTYPSSIQNQVLEQGILDLKRIRESVINYIQFGFSKDYTTNQYYYNVFLNAMTIVLEMLTKNCELSDVKKSQSIKK